MAAAVFKHGAMFCACIMVSFSVTTQDCSADGQDQVGKRTDRILGTWEVVDVQVGGESTRKSSVKPGHVFRLTPKEYIAINSYDESVAYKLAATYDSTTTPMRIALTGEPFGGIADFVGIIETTGDRMQICTGARGLSQFPKGFETKPGDGLTLKICKRKK